MSTSKPFIGGNFPQEIADAIEDCFYANRFKSKSQVIEMILRAGMDVLKDEYPELNLSNPKVEKKSQNNQLTKSV